MPIPIEEEEVIAGGVIGTLAQHGYKDHFIAGEIIRAVVEALELHRTEIPQLTPGSE